MCLFKRKKKIPNIPENHLYELGETVLFKHRGDVTTAYVYECYLNDENQVTYDLQIGGECPVVIKGILETAIIKKK